MEEWKVVVVDFGHRWNFYNCIGAMDGKRFKINPPDDFSVVLLAFVHNLDLYMTLAQMAE